MPLQTYHYAACGGSNTALSLAIYFLSYNYGFQKELVHMGPFVFQPHIAALIVSLVITLPIGFYLSMFVTFQGSYLKRRIQAVRYLLVISGCMLLNYISLKVFVESFNWYPTIAQFVTTCIVIVFNYFSQRYFSFRTQKLVRPALESKKVLRNRDTQFARTGDTND
jgi:putative flippase GtrA